MPYKPSQQILEKYADVLVNFALRKGRGIKKGDVVQLVVPESAKDLMIEVRKKILLAGGHIILNYLPDNEDRFNLSYDLCKYASNEQLSFQPKKYINGIINQVDNIIFILSETDKHSLSSVNPKLIMKHKLSLKYYWDKRIKKENQEKLSWTIGLYGTQAMADEAKMSLKEYWDQIIHACFLDYENPIEEWKKTFGKISKIKEKLDDLGNCELHMQGDDVDLRFSIGEHRSWKSGGGANIPSFEIYTSPDWKTFNGWIKFNQPLYHMSQMIEGIHIKFKKGKIIQASATKNNNLLKEILTIKGADKIGEFSLTDKRFSRITRFMAETLYDENIGGPFGNTHLAIGKSFDDCYSQGSRNITSSIRKKLGFNESAIHIDIMSTSNRTVTAHFADGTSQIIYQDGVFVI